MRPYELPDLRYDYGALEPHYSAQTLELHHDKHHAAYVKGVNEALEKLGAARASNDLSAIVEFFGSYDAFRKQLSEAAITVQGSGWGALSWEPLGERLYIEQIYDHQGNTGQSGVPLLVIDAWEHAYYLQYQNRRADYVDAIWNLVDWRDVAARLDRARDVVLIEH